jgi:hypothetical protein
LVKGNKRSPLPPAKTRANTPREARLIEGLRKMDRRQNSQRVQREEAQMKT